MKKLTVFFSAVMLFGAAANIHAEGDDPMVVTMTNNAAANQLLVYNTTGQLVQTVSTAGKGGVGGNAGGVTARQGLVVAVNFGSKNVAVLGWNDDRLVFRQLIAAASSPVSLAIDNNHLYILGTTKVESHFIHQSWVTPGPDGVAALLKADGSAAQVGVVWGQLVVSEKSNAIETVDVDEDGRITSPVATLVQSIPANVNAPFGLVAKDNNAYVTIAHADEISLVRNGKVVTTTPSVTQHAPCWLTLVRRSVGSFVYSANSPSMTISRYAVYGQKVVQDLAVAASLNGAPTDIASGHGLLAVIYGTSFSVFSIDEDGNLIPKASANTGAAINGVAIVSDEDR